MKCYPYFLFFIMIIFSCSDDTDYSITNFAISPSGITTSNEHIESITQLFSVPSGNEEVCFTSARGVVVCLNTTCLTVDGQPIGFGSIQLKYVEIFDPADMLLGNKPTVGIVDGQQVLLESGGEFKIMLFYDGSPVELDWHSPICDIQMTIPCELTGDCNNDMSGWSGAVDSNGNFNWSLSDVFVQSPTMGVISGLNGLMGNAVTVEDNNYEMVVQSLGWRNCDVLSTFTGDPTSTTITCDPYIIGPSTDGDEGSLEEQWPEINWDQFGSSFSFDNTNCRIGVSFPSVTTLMNMDGGQDGIFQQNLPMGEECNFILMAPLNEEGDVFAYAIKNTIIGSDVDISISSNEIQLGNKADLISAINNL